MKDPGNMRQGQDDGTTWNVKTISPITKKPSKSDNENQPKLHIYRYAETAYQK